MKALFIGGIKSGKSKNAEEYTLHLADKKPYYLATTQFFDEEMQLKIKKHQRDRADRFFTIEEPLNLHDRLLELEDETLLIECVSMWINNMLYHQKSFDMMLKEIDIICSMDRDIVFVLNDVSSSVISQNPLTRKFVEINGTIAQILASRCDEVFQVSAGISIKIK